MKTVPLRETTLNRASVTRVVYKYRTSRNFIEVYSLQFQITLTYCSRTSSFTNNGNNFITHRGRHISRTLNRLKCPGALLLLNCYFCLASMGIIVSELTVFFQMSHKCPQTLLNIFSFVNDTQVARMSSFVPTIFGQHQISFNI